MSVIAALSILSPLFPIIAGRKHRQEILWWYVIVCLVSDLLLSGTKHLTHYNYRVFGVPFLLLEFLFISAAYRKELFAGKPLFTVLVLSLTASFLWRTRLLRIFDFVGVSFFSLAYMLYSLYGFYRIILKPQEVFLEKTYFFWVNVAFIIYGSGAFLLFLFWDYLSLANNELYRHLWQYAFVSLNIIKNICLGIGVSQIKKEGHEPG